MRTKYKPWAKPFIEEHQEVMFSKEQLLGFEQPYYLEIGSGKGQFLVDMAKKFPNKFFVGVERNVTCAGFTAKKLVEEEIQNAKLMFINAEMLMSEIKDNSIEAIFLNFSDPWPKKRHYKRRLTSDVFLQEYHRILKDDGMIIFKTDNPDLFAFSIETFENNDFKIVERCDNYNGEDEFDAKTEYEVKFNEKNIPIHRMKVIKK